MLSENFSPINRFDETATEKIFSQYSNQNTIQKKNLPLILSEMNELEGIYLIDEILQKIGVDLTDNDETALTKETFNFFLQTYFQTKEIKKQESFKTSFFSDLSRQFSPKLKGKPNPPSESSNEIIDIPNIDDVLKQNNHQKIDDIMKKNSNDTIVDILKEENIFSQNDKIDSFDRKPASKSQFNSKNNILSKEQSLSPNNQSPLAFYGNNEKNELLEENKERKSSPNRSFSGLFNESRYSHIVNIETIENNCIIHHFENEFFCIDHLVYLCQVCLGEKKKIHEQCTMTNAKNIDFPQIIENIYQDFKEFYATNYKKLENFIEILKMLEERKKSLNFQIIINSIKDQNIVPKLMVLEEKKEKILEIAHIIFEKYLERLSGLHNTRIDIMEKTKKILKTVKENYENYVISKANEKEQNEIFQIFLKNNKILINLKQESQNNEFNRLFEIMFSNEKSIVCISIFNTIFDHLSKIYSKLETDSF